MSWADELAGAKKKRSPQQKPRAEQSEAGKRFAPKAQSKADSPKPSSKKATAPKTTQAQKRGTVKSKPKSKQRAETRPNEAKVEKDTAKKRGIRWELDGVRMRSRTVSLTEAIDQRLRFEAAARGISVSHALLEILDKALPPAPKR